MGIGTQRGSWNYWTDYNWLIFKGRAVRLIGVLMLTLFTTLTPAHAAVESVAPVSTQIECLSTSCSGSIFTFESAQTWCVNYYGNDPRAKARFIFDSEHFFNPNYSAFYNCFAYVDGILAGSIATLGLRSAVCEIAMPPYTYNATTAMCERTVQGCPANSSGTPPACACNADYKFDDTKTSCIPKCTVLDEFPEFKATDKCSLSLEKGAGKFVEGECEPLGPEMVKQEQCLAKKIHALGISYTEPSSTVRTEAYQQHFVNLWKWQVDIKENQGKWTDEQIKVCAPIVAKVDAEWKKHVLDGEPSNGGHDAPHVLRKAIDIPRGVKNALIAKVSNSYYITRIPPFCLICPIVPVYIGDVQDYVNSPLVNPPACKLRWGGRFIGKKFDPVHFDLLLK